LFSHFVQFKLNGRGSCATMATIDKNKIPDIQAMTDFLKVGISAMESDAVRELLKDRKAVPQTGTKLIELQRAAWEPMGYNADTGCKALDAIDSKDPGNREVLELKYEFMICSMKTYLRSIKDRRPAKLERSRNLSRAIILEFFDACNTRMDVPETNEVLLAHLVEKKSVPNQLIIDMQRDLLEDFGWEADHACRNLGRIEEDYGEDEEIMKKFQFWQQKAQQACMRAVRQYQASGGELPNQLGPKMGQQIQVDDELKPSFEKAKLAFQEMTADEKQKLVNNEQMQKKMQVLMKLPAEGRISYLKKLPEDDQIEFFKAQAIFHQVMMAQWQAQQGSDPSVSTDASKAGGGYAAGPTGAPSQEEMS